MSTFQFGRLPPELRLQILEHLFIIENPSNSIGHLSRLPVWEYSTVNHEWQEYFEQKLYHRLIADGDDVPCLAKLSSRQTRLVSHVWLQIKLPRYGCDASVTMESMEEGRRCNKLVWDSVTEWFYALSQWTSCHPDLMLEFSVHSPSDSDHIFGHLSFDGDGDFRNQIRSANEDTCHGHEGPPGRPARWRIRGTTLSPQESTPDIKMRQRQRYPQTRRPSHMLPGVKGFRVRRQNRRAFWPSFMQWMLRRLPNLEVIWFEEWRDLQPLELDVLKHRSGRHDVKQFLCFRDFSNISPDDNTFPSISVRYDYWSETNGLIRDMLTNFASLERLSLSFAFDACDLLRRICDYESSNGIPYPLPNLAFLSLTDPRLSTTIHSFHRREPRDPEQKKSMANDLLQIGAAAARRLPNLQVMELWHAKKHDACMFRYKAIRKALLEPEVFCSGTWDLEPIDATMTAWNEVALFHTGESLQPRTPTDVFEADGILSHGHGIRRLGLEIEVVDAVSLQQICTEGEQDHVWYPDL